MEMRITVDDLALQAAGLEQEDIAQAIRNGVESRSIGSIRTAEAPSPSASAVRQLFRNTWHNYRWPMAYASKTLPPSWQVGESDERTIALLDGAVSESLLLEVYMQAQGTVVDAANEITALLNAMAPSKQTGQWRFGGGEMMLLFDQSAPIRVAIDEVISAMTVGALLAGMVLLLFLRSVGAALVVFLSVPLSVAGAFLVLAPFDIGVNLMSLGGLALGIGMLVDNAIVVIESARRGKQETSQTKRLDQVAQGTSEVASSVIAATATTLAVFLPLLFAPGFLGELLGGSRHSGGCQSRRKPLCRLDDYPTPTGNEIDTPLRAIVLFPPQIHAGYAVPLPRALSTLSWWALSIAPPLIFSINIDGSGVIIAALAATVVWIVIALQWLARHIPSSEGTFRWLFALPLRLGNLAAVQLRWWLILPITLPLTLLCFCIAMAKWVTSIKSIAGLITWQSQCYQRMGSLTLGLYDSALKGVLRFKVIGLAVFAVIAAMSFLLLPHISLRLMPETTSTRFVMDLQLIRGTDVESSRDWAAHFLQELHEIDPAMKGVAIAGEDARFSSTLDRREPHQVQLVLLRESASTTPSAEAAWLARVEQRALNAGALSAAIWAPPLMDLDNEEHSALNIALSGSDTATLHDTALAWQSTLRLMGARGIRSSANDASEEIAVIANARQLQEADISWQQFQDRLRAATAVTDIETFRPRYDGLTPSSTILPIRVQGQRREAPLSSLSAINVGTAERPIPLGTVAVFERLAASGVIYHRDGQRVATLSATALAATMDPAQAIQELHNRSPLPNGMEVINFGLEAVTTSHLQALLSLLGLAMFLVLVVMAVQFEDLLQPLLILLAVPMAVAGALPGLHVLGLWPGYHVGNWFGGAFRHRRQ